MVAILTYHVATIKPPCQRSLIRHASIPPRIPSAFVIDVAYSLNMEALKLRGLHTKEAVAATRRMSAYNSTNAQPLTTPYPCHWEYLITTNYYCALQASDASLQSVRIPREAGGAAITYSCLINYFVQKTPKAIFSPRPKTSYLLSSFSACHYLMFHPMMQ